MAVSKMEFSKKSNTKNFKGTLPCNALIKPEKDGKGQIIFGTNCNQQGVEIKVEDVIEQIQKEEGLIKVVCKGRECSYTSSVPSRR